LGDLENTTTIVTSHSATISKEKSVFEKKSNYGKHEIKVDKEEC